MNLVLKDNDKIEFQSRSLFVKQLIRGKGGLCPDLPGLSPDFSILMYVFMDEEDSVESKTELTFSGCETSVR